MTYEDFRDTASAFWGMQDELYTITTITAAEWTPEADERAQSALDRLATIAAIDEAAILRVCNGYTPPVYDFAFDMIGSWQPHH